MILPEPCGPAVTNTAGAEPTLPYPEDRGSTHYAGCWAERGHHNCAVARIAELEELVRRIAEWGHVDGETEWKQLRDEMDAIRANAKLCLLHSEEKK